MKLKTHTPCRMTLKVHDNYANSSLNKRKVLAGVFYQETKLLCRRTSTVGAYSQPTRIHNKQRSNPWSLQNQVRKAVNVGPILLHIDIKSGRKYGRSFTNNGGRNQIGNKTSFKVAAIPSAQKCVLGTRSGSEHAHPRELLNNIRSEY